MLNRVARVALLLVAVSVPLATALPAIADTPSLDPPLGVSPFREVMTNPDIHNIYLDGSWDDENPVSLSMASINAFTQTLVGSNYFDKAAQYGVGPASFSGFDEVGGGFPCGPLPIIGGVAVLGAIFTWLGCELGPTIPDGPTAGGFDPPDDNTLYVLYLPTGTKLDIGCAHPSLHLWSTTLVATIETIPLPPFKVPVLNLQSFAFAVVQADCAASAAVPPDSLSLSVSHELIEAATDPLDVPTPVGWVDRSLSLPDQLSTGEAADICQGGSNPGAMPTKPVRLTNGILVAPYWSNNDNACEPITHTVKLNETGLPATVAHQVVFDAASVSLPFSTIVDDGTTHSFSFPSPVNDPDPGTRYVTNEPPATIVVTANLSKTAQYVTEHFLTVNTLPAAVAALDTSLTPSAWEVEGTIVPLATDPLISTGPTSRYRFDHWSGDAAGDSPNTTITMDKPKTATANYVSQHLLTVHTDGLGANTTRIFNGSAVIGTASDSNPLSVFVDDGPLALSADANVNGADGTQYFFQGFTPAPPTTFDAAFTTTAKYETMAQLIADALSSGGINGPGANGLANSYRQQFAAVQSDMGAADYAQALLDLQSFISHLQAQSEKHVTAALDKTLQLDALLVFHSALCLAQASGQIDATEAATDYSYYSNLVFTLGGAVLPPC